MNPSLLKLHNLIENRRKQRLTITSTPAEAPKAEEKAPVIEAIPVVAEIPAPEAPAVEEPAVEEAAAPEAPVVEDILPKVEEAPADKTAVPEVAEEATEEKPKKKRYGKKKK